MHITLNNKKIGIWGLGVMGTAAVKFLSAQGAQLMVCDAKDLTSQEQLFLAKHHAHYINQKNITDFFEINDFILPSPGIDIRSYHDYQHKFITELDLFAAFCTKPIVAITGSIGKTTITSLLGQILNQQSFQTLVGGNIGIASFDLLTDQKKADCVMVEISSFQLEYVQQFAPNLAIWTNFYPNHLDRHGTKEDYLKAKYNIIAHQRAGQQALIPLEIAHMLPPVASTLSFFSTTLPTAQQQQLYHDHTMLWIEDKKIIARTATQKHTLYHLEDLPSVSFSHNWLVICSTLFLLNKLPTQFHPTYHLPEHRIEKIGTINNITFYNDSKGTVPEATMAAVAQFPHDSIHLFLGGLSKGIDRSLLIKQLKNKVCFIHCFGKEADTLYAFCKQEKIPAHASTTLNDAFAQCIKQIKPGDIVLLSPSGSSYDLFNNYEERGRYFKQLVQSLEKTNQ